MIKCSLEYNSSTYKNVSSARIFQSLELLQHYPKGDRRTDKGVAAVQCR